MFATPLPGRLLRITLRSVASWAAAAMLGRCLDPYDRMLEFAIFNGLASLLALYVGLGREAPAMRIVIFLAGLSAVVAWEATFGEWPDYYPPLFAAASNATAILVVCTAARMVGSHLAPARWSVRDLLGITAVIAVLLATLGWLRVGGVLERVDLLAIWCIQGLALAIIAIAVVWPVRARRPTLALLTVPGAIAFAVAVCSAGDYWLVGYWPNVVGNLRLHVTVAVVHAIAIGGPVWALEMNRRVARVAGATPATRRKSV